MKKFKISFMALSIVMMASFIAIPGGNTAQAIANPCYRFTQNLTVGSTGPDVAALQTWLVAHGFDIPTLKTDSTQIGYFGAQTKEAVMRYQASVGIPNTGFVGPMTREAINGGSCTSTTSGPSNSTASTTTSVVISLDVMNPISSTVVSEKDYTIGGLPVLIYDVTAVGGSATMVSSQIKFAIDGPGYISLARLYQGSNLIGSSAIKDGIAQFVNLNWSLPVSAKVPVLLKVDVVGVTASTTIRAQTVKLMFVNSKLSEIGSTGEAIGNKIMIVPVAGSIPSCDTINIGGYEYRLDPCHLDITMIDGQGDRSFLTKIITSSNSYMFSVYGYGEGFPTYSLIPSYSSGGASGNRTLPFLARDQFLNTDKINSKVFSGYVPIRIDSVSENGSGNDYLKLYVNVTVLPASMPTVPVTEGTISTYLTKDFGDYAGSYNKFSPGYGLGGLSQDWNWSMRVKIQGVSKSVKSISVTTDRGEVWTTNAAEFKGLPYPLVIRDSYGKQLNNSYETNNLLVLAGNSVEQTFRLSGQIETQTWPGGKVTIKFDDGSVLSGDIPASSYSPNSSQNNNIPEITNAYAGASDPLTIYRGETIYIYGSNFIGNNASSTTVYLQNALSPYSIPAVVTQIWTGNIHATAPTSLIPGETYDLYVANDLGTSTPIKVKVMGGAAASGAPVITGGSFPTYLNVGQVGTWSVNAYDPSNGPLSYSVRWGDMGGKGLMGGSEPFVQTTTFTHVYSKAGTYTVSFIVSNNAGLTASTTTTVNVGIGNTVPVNINIPTMQVSLDPYSPIRSTIQVPQSGVTLAVIDLRAGDNPITTMKSIQLGSDSPYANYKVKNVKVYMGNTLIGTADNIGNYNGSYYYNFIPVKNVYIPANATVALRIVGDISMNSPYSSNNELRLGITGFVFDSPGVSVTDMQGNSKVQLYGAMMSLYPSSPIPISASTSAAQSSVNIVRPSGGESWQSGTIQNLEFNISPIGPNEDIYLLPANCSSASTCSYTIYLGARGTLVYQGPTMWGWTVGRLADSSTVPSGSYQLKICVANTSTCAISKPFTIMGSNSTVQSAVNITAPYSGQQFVPGDTMRIKWSSQNVKVGAIDVMTQNQQTMLVSQSFGTDPGYYDFTLPSNLQMGTYTVRLRSTSGLNSSVNFNVTRTSYPIVTPSPSIVALTASCYASVSNYGTPQATWVAAARGGSGQYQYSWSAYNDVSKYTGGDTRSYSFSASYSTSGTKQAVVRVVDASGNAATATCSGSIPTYQSSYTTSSVYSPTYTATPTATYSPTSTASPSPTYSPTYTASPSVTANPVIASCSGTASNNGTPTVTWNSNPSGGSTPYRYYWSMGGVTSIISGGTQSSSLTATYSSSGTVSASLRIVDNTGSLSSTSCSVTIPSYSSATPSVTVSPTSMNNQTNLNASIWDAVKQWFANQQ
ncbi:MAG: peptidoglycan-binding protein [Patescibacteria group bacterium]|nr:peptidoglycan-binding protein [Patescibacteria group bacterium]